MNLEPLVTCLLQVRGGALSVPVISSLSCNFSQALLGRLFCRRGLKAGREWRQGHTGTARGSQDDLPGAALGRTARGGRGALRGRQDELVFWQRPPWPVKSWALFYLFLQ